MLGLVSRCGDNSLLPLTSSRLSLMGSLPFLPLPRLSLVFGVTELLPLRAVTNCCSSLGSSKVLPPGSLPVRYGAGLALIVLGSLFGVLFFFFLPFILVFNSL